MAPAAALARLEAGAGARSPDVARGHDGHPSRATNAGDPQQRRRGEPHEKLNADTNAWQKLNDGLATTYEASAASSYSSLQTLVIALLVITALLATGIAYFLTRGIKRSVDPILARLQLLMERCTSSCARASS